MAILAFCSKLFVLYLLLSALLGFGIAGFYVDKNTNILEIERKKRQFREKSMSVEALKSQIKNKNLSLGGTMGVKSGEAIDDAKSAEPAPLPAAPAATGGEEDLNAPLNLNLH